MNRREAVALLPRYVTGTLSRPEMEAVQGFVDSGAITREQIDAVTFVAEAPPPDGDAVSPGGGAAPPQNRAHGRDALAPDGEPMVVVREAAGRSGQGRRRRPARSPTPAVTMIAILTPLILMLGLALWLALREAPTGAATATGAMRMQARDGDFILGFAPGVTEAQVRALLLKSRASIVAGPSADGLYHIALDEAADLPEAEQRLRASGLVRSLDSVAKP